MDLMRIAKLVRRADTALEAGNRDAAIASLQRATAIYSLMEDLPEAALREYADACQRLGELQIAADRAAAAMPAYQEAADLYGRLGDAEANAECARRIREGVMALRKRPHERLYLLIARYEREICRLAEQLDTEGAQAECQFHIATILQRRERFAEAADRYRDALEAFRKAPESGLQQAECHHRLADLYSQELSDDERAFQHFRDAAKLYRAWEPVSDGRQINRILCELHLKELATPIGTLDG